MRLLITFLLALTIWSCGPGYHLRRSKHHLDKAIEKGATVTADTIYKDVILERTVSDTVVKNVEVPKLFTDTIVIETTKWKTKTRIDTIKRTIYQQVECKADTVKVPVTVNTNISAPESTIKWWWFIIAALIGYFLSFFKR